jgi:hypothetical protein
MTALYDMSIRQLIRALAEVEDRIRVTRRSYPVPDQTAADADDASGDIGQLAAAEQEIVAELRLRRRMSRGIGLEAVDRARRAAV